MKNKLHTWVSAMRLRTLPLAASGVLTGNALALSEGTFNLLVFLLILVTALSLQVLSNLANDLGDSIKGTDNKQRVGPERAVQSGKISIKSMKKGVFISSLITLGLGLTLILIALNNNLKLLLIFLGIGIVSILAAITYTLGKKAYGYSGFGDLFVLLFFGFVAVLGTKFLLVQNVQPRDIYPALAIGLLSTAVLNMNNMRDHINDKASGKKTLVTKMGISIAKIYQRFLIVTPFILVSLFLSKFEFHSLMLLILIPFITLSIHLLRIFAIREEKYYDKELKIISLSTFILSITLNIIFS